MGWFAGAVCGAQRERERERKREGEREGERERETHKAIRLAVEPFEKQRMSEEHWLKTGWQIKSK